MQEENREREADQSAPMPVDKTEKIFKAMAVWAVVLLFIASIGAILHFKSIQ
ncbi:hypothetical protein [Magnetospira sp. QH-2]|uniref:hypothetical protein n=1 Tax=Magnetospira sp. (strain QH-2) TaxID=1288970 RepID=UPI00130DC571|nr:hypothetical protein [Magnetospira sp. QH-2]